MGSNGTERGLKLWSAIDEQRHELFKAQALVSVCMHSADCGADAAHVSDALEITYDLLNDIAGALEQIGRDHREI